MSYRQALLASVMLALPLGLGGCVAALPALAAGGLLTSERSKQDPRPAEADSSSDTATATYTVAAGAAGGGPRIVPGPLPAPDSPGYAAFFEHAARQAALDPVEEGRSSAVLAAPGLLEPVRSDCTIRPPAVLLDLDPDGSTLDLDHPASPNPALADRLAALRASDVAVFWISGASAAAAGKLRQRLLASGFDPQGRDGLLLMRSADDRKQLRRRELSETHCVVAIAGDARGDFDELYDYLKDPNAAVALESLIGEGWFLTPLPLTSDKG